MKEFSIKAIAAASVALLSVPLSVIGQSRLAAGPQVSTQPNIVLVLTDDQDLDSMPVMRNLMARPEGSWMNFTNAFVNHSLCCPSRASLLTGRYAHNHGVITNQTCGELDDSNTLPVWLDDAGYETALIGKYLNVNPDSTPPGWDVYMLTDVESKANEDLLSDEAVDFIDAASSPFFLYLAYGAPHRDASPPIRYQNTEAFVPPDRPNFNEADFTDKPSDRPLLTATEIAANRAERLNAQRELLAVDDGIQRIVDTLKANGQLDNTLIIVLSDNGYSWGSHRRYGKLCPYEECMRVPMMVRYPGLNDNRDESHSVSNVDLAWTIADFAHVSPRLPQDGRSLLPLLNGSAIDWTDEVLLERAGSLYYGIHTQRWKYVTYHRGNVDGNKELYDLETDPYELENLADQEPYVEIQTELDQRLQALLVRPPVLPSGGTPTPTPTDAAVSTPTPTSTATSTPTPSPSPTPSATPTSSEGMVALVSLSADSVVGGLSAAEEDILAYDVASGQWTVLFDGSNFGLAAGDIDAFHDHNGEFLLLSLDNPISLPGLGKVDDSDILRFVPDTSGNYAAGHLEWYFDGSAADLTTNGEDIDAISLLPDGRLLISLLVDGGRVVIDGGAARPNDEDVIVFTGQTGAVTSGTWDWYFDGTSIGLTTNAEDINGLDVSPTEDTIYLTTFGSFKLTGNVSGTRSDIIACHTTPGSGSGMKTCSGLEVLLRRSQIGLGTKPIDAIQIVAP